MCVESGSKWSCFKTGIKLYLWVDEGMQAALFWARWTLIILFLTNGYQENHKSPVYHCQCISPRVGGWGRACTEIQYGRASGNCMKKQQFKYRKQTEKPTHTITNLNFKISKENSPNANVHENFINISRTPRIDMLELHAWWNYEVYSYFITTQLNTIIYTLYIYWNSNKWYTRTIINWRPSLLREREANISRHRHRYRYASLP